MMQVRPFIQSVIPALFILFSAYQTKAQDSIRMKSGLVYAVKIIEISDVDLKYKNFNSLDGPDYRVSRSMVDGIRLENGTWDKEAPPVKNTIYKKKNPMEIPRNYVSVNLLDLIRTDFTVMYEYLLPGNKIGLRVPFTFGFRSARFATGNSLASPIPFYRNIVFKTGLELRVYSGAGLGKVRYVFTPALYYLRVNRMPSDYITSDPDFIVYKTANAMRWMIHNGIQINPVDYIQFGLDWGFGGDIDFGGSSQYTLFPAFSPKVQFNLHMGYKF
ncbi:MAG: hypothetical protein MH137_12525 [Flavobacteriales bacterium]|nr:hypothetical protein [Flavobacteriales bacterium]